MSSVVDKWNSREFDMTSLDDGLEAKIHIIESQESTDYRKPLCSECTMDGECICQQSQKDVDNCGMERVLSLNERYLKALKNKTLTGDFDGYRL